MNLNYKIARATRCEDLEDEVLLLIAHGWKPIGGVVFAKTALNGWFWCQAMVKEME